MTQPTSTNDDWKVKKIRDLESLLKQEKEKNEHYVESLREKINIISQKELTIQDDERRIEHLHRQLSELKRQQKETKGREKGGGNPVSTLIQKELEDKVYSLKQECEQLRKKVEDQEAVMRDMKNDLRRECDKNERTKNQLERMNEKYNRLKLRMETLKQQASSISSRMTEENELLKLQMFLYHKDFDKERMEKKEIDVARGQLTVRLEELESENQSLREQVANSSSADTPNEGENISLRQQLMQRNLETQRLQRENISLKKQLEDAAMKIQGQQAVLNLVRHRLGREARRFRRAVRNLRVAGAHIQNLTMITQRQQAVQNVVLMTMRRAMAGPAVGPVAGPVAGPIAGPLVGPIAGPLAGPIPGPLAAPIPGLVAGLVFIQTVPDSLDQ